MVQRGFHRGVYLQRGRGLGNIFSSLFKFLRPIFAKGASLAIKAGKEVIKNDDVRGAIHKFRDNTVKRGVDAVTSIISPTKIKITPKPPKPRPIPKVKSRKRQKTLSTGRNEKKKKIKKQKTILD